MNTIAAIPALIAGNNYSTLVNLGTSHFNRTEYVTGHIWIKKNPDHFRWMKYGRYCMLGFVLVGTVAIFLLTRQMYGDHAAILTSLLWIFSPYILGHGCLVSSDVPSAALAVCVVYRLLRWLHQSTMLDALLTGIILGIAELTKFTLLIFYPLFIILWLLYRLPEYKRTAWFTQAKQMLVMFAVSLLIINIGYFFENTCKPLGSFRFQTTLFSGAETLKDIPNGGGNRFSDSLLGYLPVPLPANFVQGIDTQRLDFERGVPSYLRGQWADHGWWYYYLYALLIKTPLGTLGLLLLTIHVTCFIKECNTSWRDEMVILLPGIVLLAFVSSQAGFSVHSRYVIPALPFFFIWIGKIGKAVSQRHPVFSTLAVTFVLWSIYSSLWVYPHSLSYFNELAAVLPTPKDAEYPKLPGSPKDFTGRVKDILDAGTLNGYRHLLDSNIDWGQDLFYLETWCKEHPEVQEMHTALWGSYPLEATSIPSVDMPPANDPQPGWYALSVNYLYDRSGQYRYFLNFEPVARAGYSIYIYHITGSEADRDRTNTLSASPLMPSGKFQDAGLSVLIHAARPQI